MEQQNEDPTQNMTLDEWLSSLPSSRRKRDLFISFMFPSESHRGQYLTTISKRSDDEVIELLKHFLIPSCSLGLDNLTFEWLTRQKKENPDLYARLMKNQYHQRLDGFRKGDRTLFPWEGITWILDLLPDDPRQALAALEAYFLAHCQFLPDGRLSGLADAEEVIRAKWIGSPGSHKETIAFLLTLGPRPFECLVERLYDAMGYRTTLTPPQKDGGRDVIARKKAAGQKELLFIECKLRTDPIGVRILRELLGVLSDKKATKGVVVTNNRFTKPARLFARRNPRLELLPGKTLIPLINEFLGARWTLRIEALTREAEQKGKQGTG